MNLLCIDIGGTSIKFAICCDGRLKYQHHLPTPDNLEEFYLMLDRQVAHYQVHKISGIALSCPGAVNQKTGIIEGASAVPYIHHFPIQSYLETRLGFPISMENDANCAALAESHLGAGKAAESIATIIIGTGIGGSLVFDGKIYPGMHLFGGEFGFMIMNENYQILSELATAVSMAKRYSQIINDGKNYTGKEVLTLAEKGDSLALKERKIFLKYLAISIFNIQHAFDPEIILIGGGVSQSNMLLPALEKELDIIYNTVKIATLRPKLAYCHFKQEANLIGAYINFCQYHSRY